MAAPPPAGEYELRCHAPDSAVTLRSKPLTVDFTGDCTVLLTEDRLRLRSLRLHAALPDAGGAEDGGTIVLELGKSSDGRLRPAQGGGFDLVAPAGLAATITQPGGAIELTSRKPVELAGHLPAFPPRGERCRLGGQVDLVVPGQPDVTTAQLHDLVLRLDGAGEPVK